MPLIDLKFPGNARIVNDKLINIATFDILPTDDWYPVIFDFELDNEAPINERWEALGFETTNLIMNLGSIYVVFLYLIFSFFMLGVTSLKCSKGKKWEQQGAW